MLIIVRIFFIKKLIQTHFDDNRRAADDGGNLRSGQDDGVDDVEPPLVLVGILVGVASSLANDRVDP